MTATEVTDLLSVPQLNATKEAATQLLTLVNLPFHASHEHYGAQKPIKLGSQITVTNLTFVFPSRPQQPAISNLSLKIQLGKSTAITGASGSGKSTLMALLLGLYAPSPRDAIRIFSHSLSELHILTLRKLIALSPQYPPIFPTSIRANIAYAFPSQPNLSSNENVIRAAKLAGLHTFIKSLTDGYDTMIGEGGSLLSGGQTARLGLARAICRRPKILILDEPTAGLDGVSRGELVRMMRSLVKDGVTVIVVTHDEMLRRSCDAVVEL